MPLVCILTQTNDKMLLKQSARTELLHQITVMTSLGIMTIPADFLIQVYEPKFNDNFCLWQK